MDLRLCSDLMSQPLQILNLRKSYGPVHAVKGVSLEVRPGEIFGLLGPNGAGKTSIISTIITLERPDSGSVHVFGYDVAASPRMTKPLIGWVPQEIITHGFFDVDEILHYHSGYYGLRSNQARVDYLLQKLGLFEHRHKKVKQLSGGMKRRLMIAKALVHCPRLLLLDEPTAGVDVELRSTLWNFVRELKDDGVSILLTTHYLEEAEMLCDRVAIIDHGEIRREGPTKDLIADLTHRWVTIRLKTSISAVRHPALIEQTDRSLKLRISPHQGVGDLLNDLALDLRMVDDVGVREGTLEEVFKLVVESSGDQREGQLS